MDRRALLWTWGIVLFAAPLAEARKWTDVVGNQLNAEYVRVHEGQVLLRQGTRLIKCPYEKFSAEDQAYIREQMQAGRERSKRDEALNPIGGGDTAELAVDDARDLRTWTDVQGRKILAHYTGFSQENIQLLKDDKRLSYPYAGFSPADQAYVAEILVAEGRADEVPKIHGQAEEESARPPLGENDYRENDYSANNYGSSEPEYEVASSPNRPAYESRPSAVPNYDSEHASDPMIPPPTFQHSPPSPSPSPMMQPQLVMKKKCMKCDKIVPDNTKVGDRCPHCNVLFSYEQGSDGEYRDGSGRVVSGWVARAGGIGGLFFLVVGGLYFLVSLARR